MKKTFFTSLIFVLVIFLFSACDDPVFFRVSQAQKIRDAFIGGSPTNFVVFKKVMYVASGKSMYKYEKNDQDKAEWKRWGETFNDKIVSLAVTEEYLYALLLGNSGSAKVRRYTLDNDNNVTDRTDVALTDVQSIYSAGNVLFICVRIYINSHKTNNSYYYSIYHLQDGSISPTLFSTDKDFKAVLNGAAFDGTNYYLCTNTAGIFYANDPPGNTLTSVDGSSVGFTGIITLDDDTVVAISRGGTLYKITTDEITSISSFSNSSHRSNNGSLAILRNSDGDSILLLAGRQESLTYSTTAGYTYGYLELQLDETTGGIKDGASFTDPGRGEVSSIQSYDTYVSSLGKNPVNHIIQAPYEIDEEMTLFASTQQYGVWSYRERNGKMEWNAED
ncbi:MAG: hypothetical protein LBI28_01070 [Treponema sp.]|jgi:hypothetical protein|nr:hypothetical protein [Treponema sp.]